MGAFIACVLPIHEESVLRGIRAERAVGLALVDGTGPAAGRTVLAGKSLSIWVEDCGLFHLAYEGALNSSE